LRSPPSCSALWRAASAGSEREGAINTGGTLPRILYGTAWKTDAAQRLVAEAITQGFRGIDTACQPKHYNEAGVGRGVAQCLGHGLERSDLYLQTKFTSVDGHDPTRIPYDPRAAIEVQIAQSFETSLKNLQTNYVDCLVLHSPLRSFSQTLAAWRAFEAIAESGGARRLGISNCYSLESLESLYASASVKPAAVQNRFYKETGYDAGIREFCRTRGIVYQSFWTLTANPQLLASATIRAIAARHARTPAQVLFRYLVQQDIVPLTGTTSIEHMREDLAIFEFTLNDDDQAAVTALLR
jgi:diketogulonate reductase-like aldo/keto reductase